MVRKRENDDERIKTIKRGLLGSSGAHRDTRWPNRWHCRGTRQTSRGVDSRISSRYAKHFLNLLRARGSHRRTIGSLELESWGSHLSSNITTFLLFLSSPAAPGGLGVAHSSSQCSWSPRSTCTNFFSGFVDFTMFLDDLKRLDEVL
ncbi:hypothetical protein E3N88_23933 [Mikania micrantha]|uniref:Uncharacterized protein n=1 Tax=Mikania micrantha TaxID=192012 RepID=A0A5N6NEQ6_9ASTR|nr:hypothetical protein E3N88_23933 [Mikania micrantha]